MDGAASATAAAAVIRWPCTLSGSCTSRRLLCHGYGKKACKHEMQAFNEGMTTKEIFDLTAIDPWWLDNLKQVHDTELWLREQSLDDLSTDDWREVKKRGFSDAQIARFVGVDALEVREKRKALGVTPAYKRVDTCAAEFAAETPYLYSCYDDECEARPTTNKKVLILGGGPNRIGQGIEFDYCCCHASYSLRDAGYETIMMNSNPETVSTDYDTSSRLYFEPLTVEDVLNVIDVERPEGIIVQFGGQTPLKLATQLQSYLDANPMPASSGEGNVCIWGTSPASIDEAEDRDRWMDLLTKLDIRQPAGGSARYEPAYLIGSSGWLQPVCVPPACLRNCLPEKEWNCVPRANVPAVVLMFQQIWLLV
ncbi:MAG: hypothetical protein HC767_00135 [Akkermansiaceae bacterium]|nr:hypothetical protein [Akkermansiaceae bacterium]